MKFKKANINVLQLSQGNPNHKHRPGKEWIESRTEEKFLEVLADEKLDMGWQCALAVQKANYVLSLIKRSMTSNKREVILFLCSPTCCTEFSSVQLLQHKNGIDLLERIKKRPQRWSELEHLSYKERLRELGLLSLEKTLKKPCYGLPVPKGGTV